MAKAEDRDIQALKEQLVKAGLFTVRRAKQRAAVDTGRLRASISLADNTGLIQKPGTEAEPEDGVSPPNKPGIRVGTNVEYAELIEYGTSRMPAQPFLRPSWDEAKSRFNIRTD